MNEIELLNELRAEVPARPDVRREEHRLLAEIRAGAPVGTTAPRRTGTWAPRMRWGLALAGAGLAAAATVTVVQAGGDEAADVRPPVAGQEGASVVLENAALVAARTKAAEIRPDQWFYMKESQHMGGNLPTFEHWSRMDGAKDAIREDGGKLKVGDGEKGPTNPAKTQLEVESLPSDPDALLAHFRDRADARTPLSICEPACPAGTEQDVKAFGTIGWYLKFGPMIPPDKTAAMYRALAKIPNVTIEQNATDGDGRTGVGVVLNVASVGKAYYILSPDDYRYLGVKTVKDGETFAMSVLASGIVDRPGDTP